MSLRILILKQDYFSLPSLSKLLSIIKKKINIMNSLNDIWLRSDRNTILDNLKEYYLLSGDAINEELNT